MAVLFFFFFGGVFLMYSGLLFIFCFCWWCFGVMNVFSWSGGFFFVDSYLYVVMVYMSLFILGLVVFSESSLVVVFLSEVLVLVCLLFFFSLNMLFLYVFFELSVFPILVMILGYGSQVEKIGASYYLVFYTVFCSSPFLYFYFCSCYFLFFSYYDLVVSWEVVLFLSLCFLVKFPIYFLHLWLPKAHVEAPTSASMLLAGLLLKLGTVGFVRLMVVYSFYSFFWWGLLALFGMVLGSFLCLVQSDVKSLVAYSSIVHMGFVFFVLLVGVISSKFSGVLMMLSHGFVSTMMFFLVGEFFHVFGTRMLSYYSGFMVSGMFVSVMAMLVFLCNVGLPPSVSFFAEFSGVVGMYVFFGGVFIFLFVYFFVSFYFSLYVLTSSLMGGGLLDFFLFGLVGLFSGVVLMFNFFFLSLLV